MDRSSERTRKYIEVEVGPGETVRCPNCGGTGEDPDTMICVLCGGEGTLTNEDDEPVQFAMVDLGGAGS